MLDNRNPDNEEFLEYVVEVVNQVLASGQMPESLPPILSENSQFRGLLSDLIAIYQFSLALANGKLDQEYRIRGKIAGALKSLQANLRHLTWQTQRVAQGDFSQRVDFMGDFSIAFNSMVKNLHDYGEASEQRTLKSSTQKQMVVKSMLEAQSNRDEIEKINAQLKAQLEEINQLQLLLQEQAIRDQLTGLFNRRYLGETLERELARAKRSHYPVSVIMIDLDGFKNLNDSYGHQVGDMVLQSLGNLLLVKTRMGDIPCRYSGEEIVVVFPNVDAETTAQRAEYLREAFAELSFNNAGLTIQATFSAGVASFPEHADEMEDLLHAADRALHTAKSTGRNRVAVYQSSRVK
ncbi:MAG: diguanylate cyclase [Anaerolineales bacterium]|nr:diguanylate cyclase [Anaerolineales bacterium]